MTKQIKIILASIVIIVILIASIAGYQYYKTHKGMIAQTNAMEAKGEADIHVAQAQSIPNHDQELAQAKTAVSVAQAEVDRLRKLMASNNSKKKATIPISNIEPGVSQVEIPDDRDELLAADAVLIEKQNEEIHTLTVALADKTKQAEEWHAAFNEERRRAACQEVATAAWKEAVTAAKWRGRVEGVVIGLATGYIAGRLH